MPQPNLKPKRLIPKHLVWEVPGSNPGRATDATTHADVRGSMQKGTALRCVSFLARSCWCEPSRRLL